MTLILEDLEHRLNWESRRDLPLLERVLRIGKALLTLKELEHLNAPQTGTPAECLEQLIERLLEPHKNEWLQGRRDHTGIVARVKALRAVILPALLAVPSR